MRTFIIFPAHAGKEIEASGYGVAIKKYRKTNPIEAGNLIYAINKVNVHSELEAIEQGVVITETPKPEVLNEADKVKQFAEMLIGGPEDSKPEHKDVN